MIQISKQLPRRGRSHLPFPSNRWDLSTDTFLSIHGEFKHMKIFEPEKVQHEVFHDFTILHLFFEVFKPFLEDMDPRNGGFHPNIAGRGKPRGEQFSGHQKCTPDTWP